MRTGALLPVLGLLLAGCPGSNTGVDPCAGVSCAAGRVCIAGTCVDDRDANLLFGDARPDAPADFVQGGDAPAKLDTDGAAHDGAPKLDAKKPDAPKPDTLKHDTRKPDTRPPDTRPPDTRKPDLVPPGKWYQANSQNCTTFCAGIGRANVPSPDGARCMSGEVRPASGVAAGIAFPYGCWPSCAAQGGAIASASVGIYCYYPGQKQDNDNTDKTVGCFCK